jgi:hypothetical protein
MSALLHRNYRVSESWRTFFRSDHILQGKRPRGASETLSLRMLDASKRGQMRRRGAYSEADLLAVARKLYNAPELQFRVPGQRNGVLAVMGPQLAEQVVLVIGTGSGKTMVVKIGAVIANAGTTILVLPMVARRCDMLRRFHQVGIRQLIWFVDCKRSASLVIVSAEAACTQGFLEYCHIQVSKQELARIVVYEGYLTITASDCRPCMAPAGLVYPADQDANSLADSHTSSCNVRRVYRAQQSWSGQGLSRSRLTGRISSIWSAWRQGLACSLRGLLTWFGHTGRRRRSSIIPGTRSLSTAEPVTKWPCLLSFSSAYRTHIRIRI